MEGWDAVFAFWHLHRSIMSLLFSRHPLKILILRGELCPALDRANIGALFIAVFWKETGLTNRGGDHSYPQLIAQFQDAPAGISCAIIIFDTQEMFKISHLDGFFGFVHVLSPLGT